MLTNNQWKNQVINNSALPKVDCCCTLFHIAPHRSTAALLLPNCGTIRREYFSFAYFFFQGKKIKKKVLGHFQRKRQQLRTTIKRLTKPGLLPVTPTPVPPK
jgi:hypothetical protein